MHVITNFVDLLKINLVKTTSYYNYAQLCRTEENCVCITAYTHDNILLIISTTELYTHVCS